MIQAGDTINYYYSDGGNDGYVVIEENNSLIGRTCWIFKNSWGENNTPYMYIAFDNYSNNMPGPYVVYSPIKVKNMSGQNLLKDYDRVCEDLDGDGYLDLTEDERIDVVARRVMKRHKAAFLELAK